MFILGQKLAQKETEADRREFLRGVAGLDKFNIKSLAAGWIGASLLKGKK